MEGLDNRIFLEQTCKYAPLPTTDMSTPGTAPTYKAGLRPVITTLMLTQTVRSLFPFKAIVSACSHSH